MSTNKALIARIYDEMINQDNRAVIDEIYAADLIQHDPFMGTTHGVEAFKQLISMFDTAFPGHRVTVHSIIGEGDEYAVLHTHYATHNGDFMGLPPTGRDVVVGGIEFFRMKDGKVAEFWRHDDDAGRMMQLGIVPMPAGAPA